MKKGCGAVEDDGDVASLAKGVLSIETATTVKLQLERARPAGNCLKVGLEPCPPRRPLPATGHHTGHTADLGQEGDADTCCLPHNAALLAPAGGLHGAS